METRDKDEIENEAREERKKMKIDKGETTEKQTENHTTLSSRGSGSTKVTLIQFGTEGRRVCPKS